MAQAKNGQKKGVSKKTKVAIGVGAGLAAAAAAAYFLTGTRGKKNRAAIKRWAAQAEKEVAGQLRKMKTVTQQQYHNIVDELVERYKKADKAELAGAVMALRNDWAHLRSEIGKAARGTASKVKTSARTKKKK